MECGIPFYDIESVVNGLNKLGIEAILTIRQRHNKNTSVFSFDTNMVLVYQRHAPREKLHRSELPRRLRLVPPLHRIRCSLHSNHDRRSVHSIYAAKKVGELTIRAYCAAPAK